MPERQQQIRKKKGTGPSTLIGSGPGISSSTSGKSATPSKYGFLFTEHPIFTANKEQWQQNEELMYGGHLALEFLRPFEWEVADQETVESAFWWRKQLAVYPNLPDKFTTLIASHLYRYAPQADNGLDFGRLGQVGKERADSQASLVYHSCDHPGVYGTNWNAWWQQTLKMAMATGHRWIFVNAPPARPKNRLDERFGRKPYLMEFSPLSVPNWYFNMFGDLEFVVININDMDPKMVRGHYVTNKYGANGGKLLLVREGVTRLGQEFKSGGWWVFNQDGEVIDHDPQGFQDTAGELTIFPYFAQTSKGLPNHPAMSRPLTSELGHVAISLMNLSSAANFDAWDRAMGIEWLLGVDMESWNLAAQKKKEGNRWLPLPPHGETDAIPQVQASKGSQDSSGTFKMREESLWRQAQWLGIQESVGQDAQGNTAAGSNADFSATQMPRIVQIAMQTVAAQNMAIYFLEQRFGHENPKGQAIWPTKFNLLELANRVKEFFEAERLSGLRSTPLDAHAMMQLAVEKGLVANEEDRAEYLAAFIKFGELRDKAVENGMKEPGASQDPNSTAASQATRLADQKKTDGSKGSPGRPTAE